MKILIDKRILPFAKNIQQNNYVKAVKAQKVIKEFNSDNYDIVIGVNVSKLKSDGKTYIVSVGNNYNNNAIDYVITPPLNIDKIDQAVLKSGLSFTSKKYSSIIKTIESILNYKSEDAGNQSKNISSIVRLICETVYSENIIRITRDQIDQMVAFSTIHDIGKIGLPDEILSSAKIFTLEERKIMMQHPLIGAKLISDLMNKNKINNYSIAYNIIKHHHEKYDGSGYPSGLAGLSIPLEARIVAIADVYDALVEQRTYKKAYTHKETIDIITHDSGSHFDPYLVKCFLKNEEKVRKIYFDDVAIKYEFKKKETKINDNNNKAYIFVVVISVIIIALIILSILRLIK